MSETDFRAFQQQALELYQAGKNQEAYELIERVYPSFPEYAHRTTYWRICAHAVVGKQDDALSMLKGLLDAGDWYPPAWLESDPDLDSLRALPEFQAMLATCRERLSAMQGSAKPEMLFAEPEHPILRAPALIALHGNGMNAAETLTEWRSVAGQGWLVAAPQSTQVGGPDAYVWDNREQSEREIKGYVAQLQATHPDVGEAIVFGGFSRGGGWAVEMTLHQAPPARGFVVLGPYLSPAELDDLAAPLTNAAPKSVRGYILVGEQDTQGLPLAEKLRGLMRTHGHACELEVIPGIAHYYPSDFARYLAKGIAFVTQPMVKVGE